MGGRVKPVKIRIISGYPDLTSGFTEKTRQKRVNTSPVAAFHFYCNGFMRKIRRLARRPFPCRAIMFGLARVSVTNPMSVTEKINLLDYNRAALEAFLCTSAG
jgi:hypothetical protein